MSGKTEGLTIFVLALVVGWSFAVAPAQASSVTSSTAAAGGNTTVTYTVKAGATETIKDFHITVPGGKPRGTGAGPAGWLTGRSGSSQWWRAGSTGAAIAPNGTGTFTLTVPTSQFKDGLVSWKTTKDNKQTPTKAGTVDCGPDEGEPSTHGPIAAVDTPTSDVLTGIVTTLPINSTEAASSYEYFAVGSDPATGPDAETDYADFVAWALDNPVPPSWGLVFLNMSGVTDDDGDTLDPAVVVPEDPALVGSTFWLVAVVDSEDGDKLSNEGQQLITISAEGDADAIPVIE